MAQTLRVPAYVEKVVHALQERIADAVVQIERVGRTHRYRLSVMARQFSKMDHPKRQNLVWDIAEKALSAKPKDLLKISMIITYTPNELP
jgi:hypothetical protein